MIQMQPETGNGNPQRGEIFWVTLDPTIGTEVKKTRPCLIISNNIQNKKSQRVIIAPITSSIKFIYPFEVKVTLLGKEGKIMLDQIRCIDKQRLGRKIAEIDFQTLLEINRVLLVVLSLV